jgi:superfamily I DNA/RNA helicase
LPALNLTDSQLDVIHSPLTTSIFLTGPAGSGKTTTAVARMAHLIDHGVPAESILVLVPQRSLANHFRQLIHSPSFMPGGEPAVLTIGGLAQRMALLFWPIVARMAGFLDPSRPPQFLTLETAQYYLAKLVEPLIENGYFESVTVDRNRLYSQILDNLNKSSVVGFPPSEISTRLMAAWSGKANQSINYEQAQSCALLFRKFCLENNLLDFSLQLSLFKEHLWPSLLCRKFLERTYQHLIYDNVEEDYPIAHDIVFEWFSTFKSTLVIQDNDAGFRSFLGADPNSAERFHNLCNTSLIFDQSFTTPPSIQHLGSALSTSLLEHRLPGPIEADTREAFSIHPFRFYPQVMAWVASEVADLIYHQSIPPEQIAILTPFLSDSMRFSFVNQFEKLNIPVSSFRPSRSLKDETAIRALITLAKLAHPAWGIKPSKDEVRNAFLLTLNDCDLIRADLLSQVLYSLSNKQAELRSFDPVKAEMQQRITFSIGGHYEELRKWIVQYTTSQPLDLDVFFSRLFGEILSQPGFKFHSDFEAAASIYRLIESSRKFRQTISLSNQPENSQLGKEYVRLVDEGIIASQYLVDWNDQSHLNSVLLAPAYTFLMTNRPVKFQFWLDVGSNGWWTRLDQPLTQPYVLSRNWNRTSLWTDEDEHLTNQRSLARLSTGLIRRCSSHIYMCTLSVNEQGNEERGALLLALQTVLRKLKSTGAK